MLSEATVGSRRQSGRTLKLEFSAVQRVSDSSDHLYLRLLYRETVGRNDGRERPFYVFVVMVTYLMSQTKSSFHSQKTAIWLCHWLLQRHDRLQVSGSAQPAETDTPY